MRDSSPIGGAIRGPAAAAGAAVPARPAYSPVVPRRWRRAPPPPARGGDRDRSRGIRPEEGYRYTPESRGSGRGTGHRRRIGGGQPAGRRSIRRGEGGDGSGGGKKGLGGQDATRRGWEGKKKVKNLGRGAHCQWGGVGTIIVWVEARAWWLVWGIISRLVGDWRSGLLGWVVFPE